MRRALTIPLSVGSVAVLSTFNGRVQLCGVFGEGTNPGLLEILNGAGQLKLALSSGNETFAAGINFFPGANNPAPAMTTVETGSIDPVTGVVAISGATTTNSVDYLNVALPPDLLIEPTDVVRLTLGSNYTGSALFIIEDFEEEV